MSKIVELNLSLVLILRCSIQFSWSAAIPLVDTGTKRDFSDSRTCTQLWKWFSSITSLKVNPHVQLCSPALPNQRLLLVYSHFLTRYCLFVLHFLLNFQTPFRLDCLGGRRRWKCENLQAAKGTFRKFSVDTKNSERSTSTLPESDLHWPWKWQQGEACNSLRGNLGLVFKRCGEYTKVEKCYHDALKINKGIGKKENEAKDYANHELRINLCWVNMPTLMNNVFLKHLKSVKK